MSQVVITRGLLFKLLAMGLITCSHECPDLTTESCGDVLTWVNANLEAEIQRYGEVLMPDVLNEAFALLQEADSTDLEKA